MTDFPAQLYVVAARPDADPNDSVWTLSGDPKREGWENDDGFDGYGLPKILADEIARRYNAY